MRYNQWIPLNEAIKEYASGFEEDQLHSPSTKKVIPPRDEEDEEDEEDESMDEVAPPGFGPGKPHADIYNKVKKQYGETPAAYGTMWKIYNQMKEEMNEAEGEDRPKKLPLRKALGKLYPEEEPLDIPKTQKRVYLTIRPEEEEPEKIDEAEEQEKPTYQSVKKQYFDPKTRTMRDIDWIQKVEPKPSPEKSGEEVDEDVQGGGQSQVRSYRTQSDSTENPQWDLEPDETEPRKSESYPEEDEEQEEGRLDESVRNRLMKNAGIKKKADKKLDEYFYYYYNPETGKVEKKSGLHNPKTSPYLGPTAYGERKKIVKDPETGKLHMSFVPADQPYSPEEEKPEGLKEAEETGFRRVVSRPKITASPEDVEKWSKELQARKPHSEEPFIKAGEEYMKSKHPSVYTKYQAKKSEKQSTDYVDKLRNQARKELFGSGEDIEEAVQKRSYRTGEDLPEGYEEDMNEESTSGAAGPFSPANWVSKSPRGSEKGIAANKDLKPVNEYGNPAHYMVPELELEEIASEIRTHLSEANIDNVSVSSLSENDSPKSIGKAVLVDYSDIQPETYMFVKGQEEPYSLHMVDKDGKVIQEQGGLSLENVHQVLEELGRYYHSLPKENETEELSETPYGMKQKIHPQPPKQPLQETCKKIKKMLGY